jgi:hypothetical protein
MLRKIEGLSTDEFPFTNLRLVADLIYFDGPLLSYFKDNSGQHFLYYWCDADNLYNRWLVFRSTQQALSHFLTQQLTLHGLVLASDPDQMYLADLDDQLQYVNIVKIRPPDLPVDYLPEMDTLYDASLSVFHDEQAARDLIVLMQQDVQETKTKLKMYEQAATRNPEAFHEVFSTI